MIVFPMKDSAALTGAAVVQEKEPTTPIKQQQVAITNRRQILARHRKGRLVKQPPTKCVSFARQAQLHEYDQHAEFDPTLVYSQDYEMQQCRDNCLDAIRTTVEQDPEYRHDIARLFRTRNLIHTQDDLDRINGCVCRGLERKLNKVFSLHRRWAVDGVLKMQDTDNDEECMRFFSKRASQPSVNFARLLAVADRQAADEIYAQETDESFWRHYWSDSCRTLESTDSVDTL